jgi:hypothetical protein
MSHVATVQALVKDLDALETAVEKFGGELRRNQTSFKMWGTPERCLHAIRLKNNPGGYEIGLRQATPEDKDTFEFACDFFDGSLVRAFGSELKNLRNEYMAVVAERQLQRRGYSVRREVQGEQIHLYARS